MVKIAASIALLSLSIEFAEVLCAPVSTSEDALQQREPEPVFFLAPLIAKGAAVAAKAGAKAGAKVGGRVASEKAQEKAQKKRDIFEREELVEFDEREPIFFLAPLIAKGAAVAAKAGAKAGAKVGGRVASQKAQEKAQKKRELFDQDDLYTREYFEIDELD